MGILSDWLRLIAGILATIYFNQVITYEKPLWGSEFTTLQDLREALKIPLKILVFLIGFSFVASAIFEIAKLTVFSLIVVMFGYILLRFFQVFSRIIKEAFYKQMHLSVPIRGVKMFCIVLGSVVVIIGLLNFV